MFIQGYVRNIWAPLACCVSFKLVGLRPIITRLKHFDSVPLCYKETDETLLLKKSRAAIANYGAVCLNCLPLKRSLSLLVSGTCGGRESATHQTLAGAGHYSKRRQQGAGFPLDFLLVLTEYGVF